MRGEVSAWVFASGVTLVVQDLRRGHIHVQPTGLTEPVTEVGGRAKLEASGNIDLDTIRAAAESGVDFVSVGALTHSAPALDLSLILERLP